MSRYLERAEDTARLIDVDFQLRLDQSPEASAGRWLRLLEASQAPAPAEGKIDATTLTQILTLEKRNPSSIISCVAAARENLRPGAGAMQLGNVGATQPALFAGEQHHFD